MVRVAMAIESPSRPFSFSLADLAVVRDAPDLTILEAEPPPALGELSPVTGGARPRWLPRLLPVFRAGDPLRVAIRAAAAPAFGARVAETLTRMFAIAGADAGVRVGGWEGGFAVGGHALRRVTAEPHADLVVAELEPASVAAASTLLGEMPEARQWLLVHGDVPRLDGLVGLDRALTRLPPDRLVRLPLFSGRDLAGLAAGRPPGLARRRTGVAYLDLGKRLVREYLARQP